MCEPNDHEHPSYASTLSAEATSPARARESVATHCAAWDLSDLREDATVIVSELVSDAVRHAVTSIQFTVTAAPHGLRLEVTHDSIRPASPHTPSALDQGGRGMQLVHALATRHGVTRQLNGTTAWAELDSIPNQQDT